MVPCYSVESDLALDLSISALLGDNIYNFGELLAHPIFSLACYCKSNRFFL
ncbi:hypothetical protein E1A91_A11G332300v1 [Gossypium mustelinum]|uniref:PSD13 N-terminal domain-containing protein n=1 Tax=Gossypium mustelinum TaxID=34275 RepID=A0A5D2XE91_GOSMU|nr:hypothetical protein E1A91_A11G332300v1 [Gossypium mustelinum]